MILYADILFVVDLSMDWLTLALCARLTHRPVTGSRLLLSAALGALGSVLLVILGAGRIVTFVTGLALSAGMTVLSFGAFRGRAGAFCRQWLTVWGCGAVTGGVLSVLMSCGEPVYIGTENSEKPGFLPLFLATAAVVYGFTRLLQKKVRTETVTVTITWKGREATLTTLLDTGNLLTEPMTGKPVILVSQAAAAPLPLPAGDMPTEVRGIFPVIAKGSAGTRLLWAIRPDSLVIDGQPREALVAAEVVPADHYGGYGGTCPGSLVR